jgi:nicotinamidase-related amidase
VSDPRLDLLRGTRGALLVVDVQRSFADPAFLVDLTDEARADVAAAVATVQRAVAGARGTGTEVVWVRLRVPPTDPWAASNWFRGLAPGEVWPNEWEPCVEGTPGMQWYLVEPAPGELVVDKRTYDGFAGTRLEESLRDRGIDWLAVGGLTSDCCVLETAGSAFTRGFRTVVVADASASHDRATHDAALLVLDRHSAVVTDLATVSALWSG